jgi:WD40 repeat protein
MVLHLVHNLPAPQIAALLVRRPDRILDDVDQLCAQVLLAAGERASAQGPPHRQTRRWLLGTLGHTGHLDDHHLDSCRDCQAFQHSLKSLIEELHEASPQPEWEEAWLEWEIDLISSRASALTGQRLRWHRLREIAWVGIAIGVILGITWLFNRLDLTSAVTLPGATPLPAALPTPILPEDAGVRSAPNEVNAYADVLGISWDPYLSGDGRYVAFTSYLSNLVVEDNNFSQDIFVYDQVNGGMERVSIASDGSEGVGDSFSPSLSADGRFVVFSSTANNLEAGGVRDCDTSDGLHFCLDVFLHDRQTGETRRISTDSEGNPADAFSFLPIISRDGSTVAFWSGAGNLVPGGAPRCKPGRSEPDVRECLDIFLYRRATGELRRLPIGKPLTSSAGYNVLPLNISQDGRWLLVPIYAEDGIAAQIDMPNLWDLYLVDTLSGQLEPVNVASDGTPGASPSFTGGISGDGRLVAFASGADNLVQNDDNDKVDIFLRDRVQGTTELVSWIPAGDGLQVNTGITSGQRFLEIPQITQDGRWIMFMSDATDLDANQTIDCEYPPTCYHLYLHDRVSGITRRIDTVTTRIFPFAHLSPDGNWIVFNGDSEDCLSIDLCTDIYLHDRLAGTTAPLGFNLQRDREEFPSWTQLETMSGSQGWVTGVAFSPDGALLAAASNDGTVRLWDPQDQELVRTLQGGGKALHSVAFSPGGATVAAGSADGILYLWGLPAGNLQGILDGHLGVVRSAAFSPDGKRVAVGALRAVWIWDLEQGTVVQKLSYPKGYVKALAYSPDGSLLAVAPSDETVWLQDPEDGRVILRLGGHEGRINDLEFSPDGSLLATASEDQTANLWELTSDLAGSLEPALVKTMRHSDWISTLDFSPAGGLLALGSYEGTISLWDLDEGALVEILLRRRQNQVLSVGFSPDGRLLAGSTMRGDVHLWRAANP